MFTLSVFVIVYLHISFHIKKGCALKVQNYRRSAFKSWVIFFYPSGRPTARVIGKGDFLGAYHTHGFRVALLALVKPCIRLELSSRLGIEIVALHAGHMEGRIRFVLWYYSVKLFQFCRWFQKFDFCGFSKLFQKFIFARNILNFWIYFWKYRKVTIHRHDFK